MLLRMSRRATKGNIRDEVRELREAMLVLNDAVTADDGPGVVEALEDAEACMEAVREQIQDRYSDLFDDEEEEVVEGEDEEEDKDDFEGSGEA